MMDKLKGLGNSILGTCLSAVIRIWFWLSQLRHRKLRYVDGQLQVRAERTGWLFRQLQSVDPSNSTAYIRIRVMVYILIIISESPGGVPTAFCG
jgi:hypothetical protein